MHTVVVRTEVQKALLQQELVGQLSDGFWENSSSKADWQRLAAATVVVASEGQAVGCSFKLNKRYDFANDDLLDCVGDRMLELAQSVSPMGKRFDMCHLRSELKNLKQALRQHLQVV